MEVKKIYFDMDGVLADFARGVREMCNREYIPQGEIRSDEEEGLMWEAIRKVDHFYARLEPLPGAIGMLEEVCRVYGDRCEILTGVPKESRGIRDAGKDKIAWMRRMFPEEIPVNIVMRREKKNYCKGAGSILIDDLEKTVLEWREKGGIAVLHLDADSTLAALKEMGLLAADR